MKINRLYIKNFITVMAIVIVAQICIAGLFRIVGSAAGKEKKESELSGIAFLVQDYMKTGHDEKELTLFLKNLSGEWFSRIWFEDRYGNLIASSTELKRPPFPEGMEESGRYGLFREPGGPPDFLIVKLFKDRGTFYIESTDKRVFMEDLYFIMGLFIITLMVALILFPISRKISVPLKKLTESANAISRGKFDMHVEETSHDEVGELARAFNIMSGRVLQMIEGTKELTANISHQIRSPLTRMSVSAELTRKKISAGKQKEAETQLLSIEQEIDHIVKLTERIIELIHVDISHKSGEYEEVSLTDLAAQTSVKFSDLMNQKSIVYCSDFPKIPVNFYGLHRDLCELFDILFDNAVRYSPEEGTVICAVYEENEKVLITVANDALWVTDEMFETVFDPFKRFAPEKIPGNGLGLAIAKRIAENHGGRIHGENRDGRFFIEIVFSRKPGVS